MPRKIRFYLDEHVPRAVVQGLRERGVDIKTVVEAGLHPICKYLIQGRYFTADVYSLLPG